LTEWKNSNILSQKVPLALRQNTSEIEQLTSFLIAYKVEVNQSRVQLYPAQIQFDQTTEALFKTVELDSQTKEVVIEKLRVTIQAIQA
ncbi:3455_t:CDS:1, partial [Racocetra persica]